MSFPYGTNAKPLVVFITFFVDLKQVVDLLFTRISLRIIHLLSQTISPKNLIPFPHINHWQKTPLLCNVRKYLPPSPFPLPPPHFHQILNQILPKSLSLRWVVSIGLRECYAWVNSFCKWGTSFVGGSFHGNTCDSYSFDWLYTSVNYDLYLCAPFSCYSITQTQSSLFYLSY